jgi:2-polyprenyl-3-methyl-5-hydroxy-6-metoxy-1,4-benzoquinol methylase
VINPHFDDSRVIWKDAYSGQYAPVPYSDQFDPQWKLYLEKRQGFTNHTGVETDDAWIDDRIHDLTGHHGVLVPGNGHGRRDMGGRQRLDLRFGLDFFRGKQCIDLACGAGRWTKTLLALGASVKSVDVSEHGLASVKRFNQDVERLNLFDIATRPDLHHQFDFAICWGVVMSTHDPALAFANAATTVRPGGGLYVMVYAPTYHNSPAVLERRAHYHRNLRSAEERLRYVYEIADDPGNAINYLDMLNPFYNWVVEEETIHRWFHAHGFINVVTLNASEGEPVAYHVFGTRRSYAPPIRDDHGARVPQPVDVDGSTLRPLSPPFRRDSGFAWQVALPDLAPVADDLDAPNRSRLVLLENGTPLWLRHTQHDEIRTRGLGTYSHWRGALILSTPDNTDPNTNGRTYQVALAR